MTTPFRTVLHGLCLLHGKDEPDLLVVEPALKLAAPLEFTFAGDQGGEDGWHGAGELQATPP